MKETLVWSDFSEGRNDFLRSIATLRHLETGATSTNNVLKQLPPSKDENPNQFQFAHLKSPKRRPLDFFFGRFNPHVETRFILITSWNFDSYRIPYFCDDFMEVQPRRTRVWPRSVHRNGKSLDHVLNLAWATPTCKMCRYIGNCDPPTANFSFASLREKLVHASFNQSRRAQCNSRRATTITVSIVECPHRARDAGRSRR